MKNILLVEDDVTFSNMLKHFLERHKYVVEVSYTIKNASTLLKENSYNLIFTDLRLPDGNGIDLLKQSKNTDSDIPVVLMTSYAEVSTAVQAMKQGAFDYISKPFNPDEVLEVINNALEVKTEQITEPKKEDKKVSNSHIVTGISAASKSLYEHIHLVAPTDMSVLITGESGTGKEVVASTIHTQSLRKDKPFIAVDCGAIPKEIASSEFFGHQKGSFTGAINDKIGHFEAANGGTLFLDEVGNLNYESQVQLLRALQERKIKPVGSSKEIMVDIRLITATNEDLLSAVEKGNFREDLYHRLNEFSIKVPNLNDRKDDLILYADFFLEKANKQLNKSIVGFSHEVLTLFQQYNWPGNLRELSNVIKRATLLSQTEIIEKEVLPEELKNTEDQYSIPNEFSTKENEKKLIIRALHEAKNNKTKAAKLLNITRKTLYNKLKEHNIS
ncbi:sigma-54 dependent transcriptional regulator [Tenacibaculum sp. Mcav3-52]|uniref:Sigma-54-dependent Fis family transcriptional regulator n=1 Tax=Tenacibaculum mesophilum TaxID=104268 RepID=A0AAE9MNH3_9FLAO|nr:MULTISPECIES: sigma-54 dependent transcriptional regulator [Tenacibaculum]KAF9658807.1 sigma-54-dependent Fis family transcriptional regulator [Tenacibaculum mesophilum]MCG7501265.1 sigma-54 dependent transcriptional regulator [Tenacibaculum sp. Mcav3-52]UTD15318.1 sigma-54-dependent Fis family transcriptional regulator [Tenacibaculum mesophilum]GFD82325.1 sigma-54-dependent Fis family transcriptional regulator [Tenacibaculum sp. KUL118]